MARLAGQSALLTSQGVTVSNALPRKFVAGAGEVALQMKASLVSSEDTRELVHGVFLGVQGEGVIGTSGCGVVTAVGSGVWGISRGDLVLASASLNRETISRPDGEARVGLWQSADVEVILPVSSVVRVDSGAKGRQDELEAATLPLLLSAYHMLEGLKAGDTVVIDEKSNDALQKAVAEVAHAKDLDVKSTDSGKRASIKGAQLAITSRSGSHSVNMMRTLGAGGTLVVYHGPQGEPLDAEGTVNIPVASSIFADVTIRGFGGFQAWHQSDPQGVQNSMAAVQALVKDNKLSQKSLLAAATVFSLHELSSKALPHSVSGLSVLDLCK